MKKRPQQVTTWFSVLSAFIATFAFAACTPVLSRGSSGAEYAVIDSGLMGDTSLHDKPVWIDNDRILYVEQTNEKRIRASDGYGSRTPGESCCGTCRQGRSRACTN